MDTKNPSKDIWTVAQAKAKLSEVIEKARHEGPQTITKNGKNAVIVVDAGVWEQAQTRDRKGNLVDFLLSSPLRGSGIRITRLKGKARDVDL